MFRDLSQSPCPDALIIGLVGQRGTGKTTIARYLCSDHSFTYVPLLAQIDKMRVWSAAVKEEYETTGHYMRIVTDNIFFVGEAKLIESFGGVIVEVKAYKGAPTHADQPKASIELVNVKSENQTLKTDATRIIEILLEEMKGG